MAAKGEVNFIEQHIEKIVLGVCALVLVFVLVRWVASSPRSIEVISGGGISETEVGPGQADQEIVQAARVIQRRNDEANSRPLPPLNWDSQLRIDRQDPAPKLPAILDLGMLCPLLTPPEGLDANSLPSLELVTRLIPAPNRPVLWVGFECLETQPSEDVIACHGVSVFPWAELQKDWSEKLTTLATVNVVVLRVEVEVQSRQPGERWPEEGAPGEPLNVVRLPWLDDQGRPRPVPQIPDYDGTQAKAAEAARVIADLQQNWQWYALNPPYPNVFHPPSFVPWTINLPEIEGWDQLFQTVPSAEPGYPPAPAPRPTPMPTVVGPGPFRSTPPGGGPYTEMPPGYPGGPGYPPGGRPGPTPAPRPGPFTPEAPAPGGLAGNVLFRTIPDLATQVEAGKVLAVFHDNSLKLGRYYRYRLRLVLLNPLFTYDDLVRDAARDARTAEVRSPWSPWSQEGIVEDPTRFFLTGSRSPDQVRVTVFTRKLGQTVMQTFMVRPGTAIGGSARVQLAKPTGETAMEEVSFATGAVAVEFDFKRPYTRGAGGTRIAGQTTAMIYLTRDGQLRTRVQAKDEQSEPYKRLTQEARGAGG